MKLQPPKPRKNALLLCHSLSLTYGSLQQCKSTVSVRDRLRVRMLFPGLSCPRVPASHPIFLSVINNAGEMAATRDESPHRNGGEPTGSWLQSPKKYPPFESARAPTFSVCLIHPPPHQYHHPSLPRALHSFLVVYMYADHVTSCYYGRPSTAVTEAALKILKITGFNQEFILCSFTQEGQLFPFYASLYLDFTV